jgi:hypothetical protein
MAKSARKRTPSTIVNRTVPRRAPNSELRTREYLTEKEIERLASDQSSFRACASDFRCSPNTGHIAVSH